MGGQGSSAGANLGGGPSDGGGGSTYGEGGFVGSGGGTALGSGGALGAGGENLGFGGLVGSGGQLGQGGLESSGGSVGTGGAGLGGALGLGGMAEMGGVLSEAGTPGLGGDGVGGEVEEGGASGLGGESTAGGAVGAGGLTETGSGGSFGDVPACETNQISSCSGTNPISCHFGGEPGDYRVTVELGGVVPGDTIIDAEAHRRVLGQVVTSAGETRRVSFLVNVREPEGQPVQDVPAGTPGLDIILGGTAPQLTAICFEPEEPAPKLWVAGDSTVCDQSSLDYAGWGQHLPQFFRAPVSVANYADSGESSGSFLGNSRLWGAIKARWSAGDWVLIQLGHNDKTVSADSYRSNISSMVTQAKSAGLTPILCTPTSRAGTNLESQHVNSTGANLPEIVREIAATEQVPLIDLTVLTYEWQKSVDWSDYFALGTDRTHTNHAGAEAIAVMVRDAIAEQNLGLASYLR